MAGERERGFEEAFDELFVIARRSAARVLGESAAAEDAAAETLGRALAAWPKVRDLPYRDAWIRRVATNVAVDLIRKERVRPVDVCVVPDIADLGADRVSLAQALGRLPRRQRDVVTLRYLSDMSEADVSRVLRISLGSVKRHGHRGLAALRRALAGDGPKEPSLA